KLNDEDVTGVFMDSNLAEVAVLEACLQAGPFMGAYEMVQTTPFFGPASTTTFTEGVVQLTLGSSIIERRFATENIYPTTVDLPGQTISILFTCDGATIANNIDTGIGCSGGTNIILAPSNTPG